MSGKMMCEDCEMYPACVETDGNVHKWLCRRCVEATTDIEDCEPDDSLIFCETEWNAQEVKS